MTDGGKDRRTRSHIIIYHISYIYARTHLTTKQSEVTFQLADTLGQVDWVSFPSDGSSGSSKSVSAYRRSDAQSAS